uniref:Glutaredoxin-related protein 5, mitochondrial n=1 Tax=Plectus sambesii TaxID=2011161 RepID=A0A914VVB4_9BILA
MLLYSARGVSRAILNGVRRCQPVMAASYSSSTANLQPEVQKKIEKAINSDKVVVFMKGTQQEPMCGFSRNVKLVLDFHEVPFRDYNVLADSELREGIKAYSDWPTIPQIYVNKKFVGGCDILVQMHKDGEITDFLDNEGIKSKFSSPK